MAAPPHDAAGRSPRTDELWAEAHIDPVMIALPGEIVGYTLRAYRLRGELTPTDVTERESGDPFADRSYPAGPDDEDGGEVDDARESDEPGAAEFAEEYEEDLADDGKPDGEDEETPVFLSHRGRLLLFGSPESLVTFIGSDAPHDLTQLDTWPALVKRVRPADIVPTDADSYELDLVVENLRGGHDAWDPPLLISAGEIARDLAYALRLEPVRNALAADSPLDDLDEALRAATAGGLGAMLGRRRLRRIGAQQASLGWRTIIGKISGAVDWRD